MQKKTMSNKYSMSGLLDSWFMLFNNARPTSVTTVNSELSPDKGLESIFNSMSTL
jgi:hypothetical protein